MLNVDHETSLIAEVIVAVLARNVDKTFDYLVPPELTAKIKVGSRVIVPFGPRKVQGFVLYLKEEGTSQELKAIDKVLDKTPPLTTELIELGEWMSKEYICLKITALHAMLPAVFKSKTIKQVRTNLEGEESIEYEVQDKITRKLVSYVVPVLSAAEMEEKLVQLSLRAKKQREVLQFFIHRYDSIPLQELLHICATTRSTIGQLEQAGCLHIEQREQRRDPFEHRSFQQTKPLPLTDEQQKAYVPIVSSIRENEYQTFLLHGVTGSGKTEVYLQSISFCLEKGKEAIVLVPEISLTPQMVERFKGRFGNQVAVIHSRLSAGERFDEWRKVQEGQVKVVIGARSALFAPFTNIGLIIIDEEHESSYKQEESPRYHARDVAVFRGQFHQAPVVLGSATPTLESFARGQKGVYQLLSLMERVQGRNMPSVQIVDMKDELQEGNRSIFSRTLYEKIVDRLDKKEQIVLFLNRRGFSTFVMCRDCGYVIECPHCDIALTYHKVNQTNSCHYCGYQEKPMSTCSECSSSHIRFFGTGTQKVEEELIKHFPGIRVIRMDVDTTQKKNSHERLLETFSQGRADCLLGTQMIAKGLDFEKVTLVGVIAADSLLHLPDFRAAEKTFQLLTQVSGRAGRHQLPGEVIVQTYTPEHYSIQAAAKHDYLSFYQQEMNHRRSRGYPPYFYITLITFSHPDLPYLVKVSQQAVDWLKQNLSQQTGILGPVASPVPRIKDRYRYQCMIKYRDEPNLGSNLFQLLQFLKKDIEKKSLQVQIDKNPQMVM